MKKKKVTKSSRSRSTPKKKGISNGLYATQHDMIIIAGGGLVVLMLTLVMFFLT